MTDASAVRIYVPDAVADETHKRVQEKLVNHFGGYTGYSGEGAWSGDDGRTIREPVTVYESVTDFSHAEIIIKDVAQIVKEQSDESAVMWEIRPVRMSGMV